MLTGQVFNAVRQKPTREMWLQRTVVAGLFMAAILNVVAIEVEALSSNNETVVDCRIKNTFSVDDSPSFLRARDSHETVKQLTVFVQLDAPLNGTSECMLDIGGLVEQLPEDEVMVFFTKLVCTDERPFRVILENSRAVERKNGIGYLWVTACRVFWKHMAVYGRAVDMRVLYLEKWQDQFEEELESFGTPARFPSVYDEGLRNVGTMAFFQQDLKNNDSQSTSNDSLPTILTDYLWPEMAELTLFNVTCPQNSHDMRVLASAMPRLQTLEIQHCHLTIAPDFFPWDEAVLTLPRNLSRSSLGNDHYGFGIGINIEAHEFRRLLRLDNNDINDLTTVQFKGRFDAINLRSNNLRLVGNDTFRNTTHLQVLDLSINNLITVPETTLHGLDSLVHLDLSYNLLTTMSPETFRHLISLQTIDLQNNQLTSIDAGFFSFLPSLQQVDVSSNNLTYIDDDAVPVNSVLLQSVNFAKNQLTEIPKWLFVVRKLRMVDLSDNLVSFDSLLQVIRKLDVNVVMYQNIRSASAYSPDLSAVVQKTVNFRRNNFTTISMDPTDYPVTHTFLLLSLFFQFKVEENPIECDCYSYSLYEYLKKVQTDFLIDPAQVNVDGWICNSPAEVKGTPLVDLPPTTFRCPRDYPECPDRCTCYERIADGAIEVDCRNRSLAEMPTAVPLGTQVLHIDRNEISEITGSYQYFQNLTCLSLAYNTLTNISDSALGSMAKITHLHLHNNRLRYLPKALESMNVDSLQSITLKSNPFVCDCHSRWLKNWLLEAAPVVADVDDMLCTAGKPRGKLLTEAQDDEYVCMAPTEPCNTTLTS